jgi:hypothetical protein
MFTAVALVSAQAPPPAQGAAPGTQRLVGPGGRGRGANRPPAGPTPRLPDDPYLGANAGKPDLGGNSQSINAKQRGIWQVPYIVDMQRQGKAPDGGPVVVPFTPLGQKFFDAATATNSKDDPEGFCLPPGVPRMMYTPYPTEIFQLPNRIVFVFEGAAHVWRNIWLDGREQPKDPNPDYLGYSVGKWEGDTLVVTTVGFDDRAWVDAYGYPISEKAVLEERYSRPTRNRLRLDMTLTDPTLYTRPWHSSTKVWGLIPKKDAEVAGWAGIVEDRCVPQDNAHFRSFEPEPAGKPEPGSAKK